LLIITLLISFTIFADISKAQCAGCDQYVDQTCYARTCIHFYERWVITGRADICTAKDVCDGYWEDELGNIYPRCWVENECSNEELGYYIPDYYTTPCDPYSCGYCEAQSCDNPNPTPPCSSTCYACGTYNDCGQWCGDCFSILVIPLQFKQYKQNYVSFRKSLCVNIIDNSIELLRQLRYGQRVGN